MAFSLCACGGSTYGVRELEVLVEQEYSLAFRNDDSTYNYVTAAIETLNAEGTVGDPDRQMVRLQHNRLQKGRQGA